MKFRTNSFNKNPKLFAGAEPKPSESDARIRARLVRSGKIKPAPFKAPAPVQK